MGSLRALNCALVTAMGLLHLSHAVGQVEVIADTGRTVTSVQHLVHALDSIDSDAETPLVIFPVSTPTMSPGILDPRNILLDVQPWMTQPLFIVGTDPISLAWLESNKYLLLKIRAAGLVISAPDVASFKSLRRAIPPLPLVPSAAPSLTKALAAHGITRYPLLLLENGRVVQDLQRWHSEQTARDHAK